MAEEGGTAEGGGARGPEAERGGRLVLIDVVVVEGCRLIGAGENWPRTSVLWG